MDKSGLHNVSGLINCKWTWTSSTKHVLNFLREIREREKIAASRLSSREAIFTRARVFFSRPTFPRKNAGTERGNAQSSPWDMWISSKLFLDQFNPWINRKFFFRRGPQTFIQSCRERIEQSSLKYRYSAFFVLRQSRVHLITFQAID